MKEKRNKSRDPINTKNGENNDTKYKGGEKEKEPLNQTH